MKKKKVRMRKNKMYNTPQTVEPNQHAAIAVVVCSLLSKRCQAERRREKTRPAGAVKSQSERERDRDIV